MKGMRFIYLMWNIFILILGLIFYYWQERLYLVLLIIIAGMDGFFYLLVKQKQKDILAPNVLLPFTFMLYSLGPLFGNFQFTEDVIVKYLFIQLLGLVSLKLGLSEIISQKIDLKSTASSIVVDTERHCGILLVTVFFLLLLSLLSLITIFAAFGGLEGFIRVGYGGEFYLTAKNSTTIGAAFEWGLLGGILLMFYYLKCRSGSRYFAAFIGFIILLFLSILIIKTGRRHQIVYPLLFGISLWHYGHKKIPTSLAIAGLIGGISLAQYYSLARFFLPESLFYSLTQTWLIVKNNPSLLLPFAANEFKAPSASLLEILQFGGPGLLWGKSYVALLGAPLPFVAKLFSQISFDVNRWRLETYYPDIWAAGGGLGFSPVTEGYMNFGLLGVILQLYLYGLIISRIYIYLMRKQSLPSLLLYAGSLPVFMLNAMRIHSISFCYTWVRIYLMPWLLFWIVLIITPSKKSLMRR